MATEIWGLSLNQTLLLIAAILCVIDFFIPTDLPTHIAYIIICVLIAFNVHAHLLIKILCSLIAWFGLVAFHYLFWRATAQKFVNSFIAPDRFKSGAEGLVGSTGMVKVVDHGRMVKVKGDLWPCEGADDLREGEDVYIRSVKDGVLVVQHTGRNE